MQFDTTKLAVEFRHTIHWMLGGKWGNKIKRDLQLFKNRKADLETRPDSSDALRSLVEFIVTEAWYYKKPASLDSALDSFVHKHGGNIRSNAARNELVSLVERLAPPRIREKGKKRVEELLTNYPTLRDFTQKLYQLARQGKSEVLGEKGRDNFLRDFGYWDRIPIDRHEMRFVIRTGIYHACSISTKNDPLEKGSLHDALTRFCSVYLRGEVVENIDLNNAPGIVDIFIWYYCGKEGYNICGSTPKCETCRLREACLYSLTNIQWTLQTGSAVIL